MHAPATRETTRLNQAAPTESSIGVSLDTPHHSLKVVYRRQPAPRTESTLTRALCLGLFLGGLLMLGVMGYGMPTLGGAALAALILLAVWSAGRE